MPTPAAARRAGSGSSTHQPTQSAATKVKTAVTTAIVVSGRAKRTDQPSGRRRARCGSAGRRCRRARRCRSAARACCRRSPRAARPAPARRAPGRRSARSGSAPSAASRKPASTAMTLSTWPSGRALLRRPGPGRRSAAARPARRSRPRTCRASSATAVRGCWRASRARVAADSARLGDGQDRAHACTSSSPVSRVTTRRYAGFVSSSSRCVPAATIRPSAEERDLVGVVEHQRAGGGDDGGAAGAVVAQPGGDPGLGVRVDGGGRLDQHQDLRVGEQRAGQHQPLPLAAGEDRPRSSTSVSRPSVERLEDVVGATPCRSARRRRRPRRRGRRARRAAAR